ncbi:MAG: sulfatase/phosphatase domain-containing protein, partial [Verrucomicrobiota bacterium]
HGFQVKKAPYDSNIRSPLIFSMPSRLPSSEVCNHPVGGTDIAPTLLAFAGVETPWTMHGHDLSPLLTEPTRETWDHPVLTIDTAWNFGDDTDVVPIATDPESHHRLYARGQVPWWVSLVEGHWKYIRTLVPDEPEELYDLQNDPEELTNLARDPDYREQVLEMRAATLEELRRTGADLVDSLPAVAALPTP